MNLERPITTTEGLRALIPAPLEKIRLKILGKLERHSQHMIAMSSLAAFSCEGAPISLLTARGLVVPQSEQVLRVDDPEHAIRHAWGLANGASRGVGGLFMVGGIDETLRLNGHASVTSGDDGVLIEVKQAFLQCPKAFVRSRLWDASTWSAASSDALSETITTMLTPAMRSFVDRSPFGLVCTENEEGHGDVSPRGDPAGSFVRCLDERTLLLPDRTGNNLVDTLLNILAVPRATVVLMIPGETAALELRARARIVADEALLAPSAVKGKAPKVGILLDLEEARFLTNALAPIWNPEHLVDPKDFPTMGEMIWTK